MQTHISIISDTPQNSPHRSVAVTETVPSATAGATLKPTPSTNGLSPPQSAHSLQPRQRRLSNSSMASDVSFRLPAYDSPAVYHLQSDLDCSASEYEDTASNAGGTQLDRISKEQLHSAYKKASDRYQKYRSRYTEIAARYRDLERDNNKARSVLVETQDKALRRISELREQCALEQQAKAHLENALRLEMDELQCVIKTLNSKLTTVREVDTGLLENGNGEVDDFDRVTADPLVDLLSSEGPEVQQPKESAVLSASLTNDRAELEEKIKSLKKVVELYKTQVADEQEKHEARNQDVHSLEQKVQQLNSNLNESMEKIRGLQSREEENTILLAENKMVVHSELEAKDEEVKSLRERIQQLEALQSQVDGENKALQARLTSFSSQITDLESNKHDKEAKLIELEASKIKLKEEASRMDSQLAAAVAEKDSLQQQLVEYEREAGNASSSSAEELKAKLECIDKMETELLEVKTQLILKDQEMTEHLSKINSMEREHQQAIKEERKNGSDSLAALNSQLEQLQHSLTRSNEENKKLAEEVQMTRVINENSESEAIQSLQTSIVRQQEEWDAKMKTRDDQIVELNKQIKEYEVRCEALNSEWETLKQSIESHDGEMATVKGRIETLRNEKKDLEKTLEKEIRDKNELQTQVTNILQEISRLEEQLNESKDSHAELEGEKSQLEEKIANLESAAALKAEESKSTIDGQVQLLQDRLQEVEVVRQEMAEQNAKLQEQLAQLEKAQSEAEVKYKNELSAITGELKASKNASEAAHGEQQKLKECLEENTQLLLKNEQLEQALKTLEDQREAIEKEKLCVVDTNSTLQEEIRIAKRDLFVMKDKILGLEQELETATEKCSDLDAQLIDMRQELTESSERIKSAEEGKTASDKEVEGLQKQLAEIEYRHKRADEEVQKNKSGLESELKDMEHIKVENEYLNTHVKQLELDLQKLRDETVQRESVLRDLKDKYNFAENEMSSLQEQKSKFDCLMADKNDELDQTNVQLATVKQELEGVRVTNKTQLNNLAEEVKELKSEISAKQIIINDLNQDLSRQEKELGQAKTSQLKDLEELKKTNEELRKDLREASGNSVAQVELQEKHDNLERLVTELRLKIVELETSLADNVVQRSKIDLEQSSKAGEMDELRDENETLKLKFHNLEKTLNSKLAVVDEKHKDLIEENRSLKQQAEKNNAQVVEGWEEEKADLEQRLQKIIAEVQEVSNRNMFLEQKCENFLVLEQTHERMKLANEKLSRQLDETLVSGGE